MARYRKHRRSRGGSNKFFGLSTKGLIPGLGILGLVAGVMFKDQIAAMLPFDVPAKDKLVAFGLGGPAGAFLAFGKDYLMPSGGSVSSGGKLF